uniref:Ciliary neurotrophic factor receptor n=1 Tax=Knipowitschia caucasica TaxID=637954 RepID=A0AAV2J1I0_KNICA
MFDHEQQVFQTPANQLPPGDLTITCRSNTYPKGFYCTWTQLHRTFIPTNFDVDVQHNQRSLEVQPDPFHKNRCHVRFPEVFSSFLYLVNITAINSLGKASTIYSFEESNIVKPDPPERVVATPVRNNPRRLEVSWNSPSTWPEINSFPLKYFLRYRPLIREQWQHVAAKDTEIGTWSDWSVAVHATTWIGEITSPPDVDPVIPEDSCFGHTDLKVFKVGVTGTRATYSTVFHGLSDWKKVLALSIG